MILWSLLVWQTSRLA